MKSPKILGVLFLVLTVVLSACASQATPTNPPLSTEPPLSTATTEVMGTASPETTSSADMTGTPSVSTTTTAGVPLTGADCTTVTVQVASAASSSTDTSTIATETPSTGSTVGTPAAGDYLVDCNGLAVYVYSKDTANSGSSMCTGDCATEWKPLTVSDGETPMAGTGVDDSLLSTITRDDGTAQVTYNGWPLYLFSGDSLSGDQNGLSMGTDWSLISPSGEPIMHQ